MLPVQAMDMVSSFPGWQAHVLCYLHIHEPAALRALECYHNRLLSPVES